MAERRRDAATTRARILAAARAAFARSGYDGAGLREIAAEAGVTAMLVGRYFGSKEGLFEAVLDDVMAEPVVLGPNHLAAGAERATRLATAIAAVTSPGRPPLDGFSILLKSGGSERAATLARPRIEAGHLRRLAAALDGDRAEERAAVVLALVAGLQLFRQGVGLDPLTRASDAEIAARIAPLLRSLVD